MRIAVFGVGGVGGYFGGRLANADKDVVFVARGEQLAAIREHGLRVDSIVGDFHLDSVSATDDPAGVGHVDAVLVSVKAWQVPEAAEAVRPMVGPKTVVVPLQNGVEAAAQLAAVLGKQPVLSGLCGILSFRIGPGHIRHEGVPTPFISFKEMDNTPSDRVERLRQALDCDGFEVRIPGDIQAALWSKLAAVSPAGALGAALRVPGRIWRDVPRTRKMYEDAVQEVAAVAAAGGVSLDREQLEELIRSLDSTPVESMTSMHRDILAGRPSELEAQVGAVVRLGEEAGVPTPVYSFVYGSLLLAEMKARGEIEFPG